MTDQRHPDIEIYVKNRSLEEIEHWLRQRFDVLNTDFSQGTVHEYKAGLSDATIPVMIHEKVVGKAWTSVWFKSDKTLWATDLDCAAQAAIDLDTQIRCIAGGWADGDEPDEWWKVENGEQEKIQWRTS
ncbi:hypothetical protein [Pontibacterium sp.]|jgi:hypothetical protein|uniref:hypothetical protein n=1 Tax=Pontibacterium sp. TaxID=2036026 RepID=UPI0035666B9B